MYGRHDLHCILRQHSFVKYPITQLDGISHNHICQKFVRFYYTLCPHSMARHSAQIRVMTPTTEVSMHRNTAGEQTFLYVIRIPANYYLLKLYVVKNILQSTRYNRCKSWTVVLPDNAVVNVQVTN